jgi:hypothetical protein
VAQEAEIMQIMAMSNVSVDVQTLQPEFAMCSITLSVVSKCWVAYSCCTESMDAQESMD